MIYQSPLRPLDIPSTSILDFFYPANETPSDEPLWIDPQDTRFSLSPKSARNWICRLGLGLERNGVGAGDVVMTFSPNHIYMPVAYLGVLACGAIFSGLNPSSTPEEAAFQISNAGANMILVHPDMLQAAKVAAKKANLSLDRLFLFADQETGTMEGIRDWREMLASPADGNSWKWKSLSPEEAVNQVATLNFSSGTTGLPKGVCISHKSLISNVLQLQKIYDLSKPKRWVGFLPLYHAYGQCFMILIAARYRIPVYIMKAFQLDEYLRIIETHRITSLQTVPPILIMLDKRPEIAKYDLSSVQEILCGAAPLSRELQQAMIDKLGITVVQAYGTTETTCGVFCNPSHYKEKPIGSVGVPLPNTDVKLLDDDGKEVAVGERGEVYCRGPQMALRYWRNEQASKDSFDEDGWYKTGDVGTVNEEGFFWIVDRKKELIKVKGLQVSPAELEAVLWENPDVADAAVAGITLGENEYPRAYVTLKEEVRAHVDAAQIYDWVRKRLSRHKWLDGGIVFVDEVPRLASGKIQRKILREWTKRDALAIEASGREETLTKSKL